jgi:repressor LexA
MQSVPLTRRQREILDFYQEYTAEAGISPTLEEVAQRFGINKVTIFGHVKELERKGVLRRAKKGISRGLQLVEEERPNACDLPILGTIAAGAPLETLEEPEILQLTDFAPPGKDVYVLRVQGDSMIDDAIRDGDLVVVERTKQAWNGQIVVAVLPDEMATLKRYYREPDGSVRLQPANAAMQPIVVPEVEIRGVVLGVIRRY